MCTITFAALLGLAVVCHAGGSSNLLAPIDPSAATRWHPPSSPVASLKRYEPVEARGDGGGGAVAPPSPSSGGMDGMPGMSMPGLSMPGTGGR